MTCHLSPLKNISKNSSSMPHHLSQSKTLLKIQENHITPHHLSPLQDNAENSSSIPHHLMPCHLSLLKNNSKNSKKLPHVTSPFSIVT
jgi:hypothetical protein